MTWLLIDVGNSRLKWAISTVAGQLLQTGIIELPKSARAIDLATIATLESNLQAVHVANVRGAGFQAVLQEWLTQHQGLPVVFHQSPARGWQVINGYTNPQQLGIDRWAALVAARRLCSSPLCVIDCGTAMTIDVLDGEGQHQGGMISPGFKTMQVALQQGTAAQVKAIPQGMKTDLAHDTAQGIVAGTTSAVLGLIERQHRRMRSLYPDMQTFISGGDAETVLPLLDSPARHEPQLVLQGLSIMAAESP